MQTVGRHVAKRDNRDANWRLLLSGSIAACAVLSGGALWLTSQAYEMLQSRSVTSKTEQAGTKSPQGSDGGTTAAVVPGTKDDDKDEDDDASDSSDKDAAGDDDKDGSTSVTTDATTVTDATTADAGSAADTAPAATDAATTTDAEPAANAATSQEPQAPTTQETQAQPTTYIIEWGDTLCTISRKTGRSVDAIKNANGINDANMIYAGSVLVIP